MNDKYVFSKVTGEDEQPQMEILDLETKNVITLSKWDIWHLWCDLVR